MSESRLKHLEFIQGVITRMGANSFQIKGWMITINAALLALYASSVSPSPFYCLISIFITFAFAYLDAYYLLMERQYRELYNDVVKGEGRQSDRCREQDKGKPIKDFNMNASVYELGNCTMCDALKSKSITRLYYPIIIISIIFLLILSSSASCN